MIIHLLVNSMAHLNWEAPAWISRLAKNHTWNSRKKKFNKGMLWVKHIHIMFSELIHVFSKELFI